MLGFHSLSAGAAVNEQIGCMSAAECGPYQDGPPSEQLIPASFFSYLWTYTLDWVKSFLSSRI